MFIFRKLLKQLRSLFLRGFFYSCGERFEIGRLQYLSEPKSISIGNDVSIADGANINCKPSIKPTLMIGNGVRIGRDVQINAYNSVVIEDNVLFADRVYVSDASHNYNDKGNPIIKQGTDFVDSIKISSGAWLGINTVILPGVTIGKNAVIAANSVVRGDVPDFAIASGVPAKIIKNS